MGRKFWEFRAAADKSPSGELLLYGPISDMSWFEDDVTPKQFHDDLQGLGEVSNIKVFINSPGGDAFAAQAIHSMLTRHPARVTVYVDGLAASAASLVAMAGDTVVMPRNAMMMIHNPWTVSMGDAREFRKVADTLDSIRESMIAAYEVKSGMDRASIIPLLNAETWLTAEEAVKLGFADEVEQAKKVAASIVRPGVVAMNGQEHDLSKYSNVPDFAAGLRDAGAPTKREIERALRDAGYSQTEAKVIVAGKYKVEPEASRDVPPESESEVRREAVAAEMERLRARAARR